MSRGWGWGWGWSIVGSLSTYFEDTFTGHGDELSAHTPDVDASGNGWTENGGDWELDTNTARCLEDDAEHIATCDVSVADCTVEVEAKYDQNTGDIALGLIVRGDADLGNHWKVRVNPTNDRLEVVKCEFGEAESVEKYASLSTAFQDNTAYTIQAIMSGNDIEVHSIVGGDDDSCTETDSFNATETRHGMLGFCNTGFDVQTFDEFSVVV